jgi:hypothetical protein
VICVESPPDATCIATRRAGQHKSSTRQTPTAARRSNSRSRM